MNVEILDTVEKLLKFFSVTVNHSTSQLFTLDVETNSVNEKLAKLFGIGIALSETQAYYIPIRNNKQEILFNEEVLQRIARALVNLSKKKLLVGHNIIYDVLVLKNNLGIDLTDYVYADTILMKHCVNEEPPFGLKETAVAFLGEWADKAQKALFDNIQANGGSITKTNLEMWKADTPVLAEYCGWDTLLTYQLFVKFYEELESQDLLTLFFEEEIMPLYKECVIPMKDKGFPIDIEYFSALREELIKEIGTLEDRIQASIKDHVQEYLVTVLDKEVPIKLGGNFLKNMAEVLYMPHTKAKLKSFEPINELQTAFKTWASGESEFPEILQDMAQKVREAIWTQRNPEDRYMFNIGSNQQLAWLFFTKLGIEPLSTTEKGAPQLNADTLEKLSGQHEFCDQIIEYRKLQKLLGTYVEGLLNRQYNGVIYGSFLMFGTTSGRFSSRDPNLQNLPRIKDDDADISPLVLKYTNAIKKGFVPPPGYKIVNADYSQLEPRAFAEASGDKLLQQSFIDKEDLYGSIAKAIWKLDCTANEVKKKYPELRQKAKVVALAVVYGAEAGRISGVLKCDWQEANAIITDYLRAYPGLKTYMRNCDYQVARQGFVRNKFGRVRHLPEAKILHDVYGAKLLDKNWVKENGLSNLRYKYKSYLNNAKNFPIQSTAAHVVNRAMIAIARFFKAHGIEGYIAAQVHDEITCIVREDQAEQAASLLKQSMENTTKLDVPLSAEPVIGMNWAEAK